MDGKLDLMMGDCLKCMRSVETCSVDAVVTDPPFSSGTRAEGSKGLRKSMTRGTDKAEWFGSDSLTTSGFLYLMRECAIEWARVLKPGGHILCFIDWRMAPWMADAIESADLRRAGMLVWDKTYFGMGSCFRNQHELIWHFTKGKGVPPQRRDVGNVIPCKPVRRGVHPTEKPVELLQKLSSVVVPPQGIVLDPFMGAGSCGVAAVNAGYRFIGIERDEDYFDIACDRIEKAMADNA